MTDTKEKDVLILAIESSCDETAAAVVKNGREVLSNVIYSQIDLHTLYGGVVPEIASRAHVVAVDKVVAAAIEKAHIKPEEIDAVAVTYGAGLLGALLVGVSFAKAYAYTLQKPLIAVNHIRGHLAAAYLADPALKPPFVTLLASGGHTAILYARSETEFSYLGGTKDDAAGEAFDKAARVLGLPYPGGPNIQKCAEGGTANIPFPQMFKGGGGYDFSYSGLKTAVINYCHTKEQKGEEIVKADVAASFQKAAVDVMIKKTIAAAKEKREALAQKRVYQNEYTLDLDVRDELGAIARVSKVLADNGVNISGMQIINSREGVGGALRIAIRSEAEYERAKALLCDNETEDENEIS